MKTRSIFISTLILCMLAAIAWAGTPTRAPYGLRLADEPAAHGTPPSGFYDLYVYGDDLYGVDDSGVAVNLTSGGSTAWDDIGDPDAAGTIAMTTFAQTLTSTKTDGDMFTFQGLGAFGDVSVVRIEQKTGNATNGTVLEVVSADTDVDALLVTANAVDVVKVNGAGTLSITGNTDITGTLSLTGAFYQSAIAAAASGNANLTIDAAGTGTITLGGTSTGLITTDNAVQLYGNTDIGNAASDTLTITASIDGNVTLDDGVTDSPSLIFKDATDETATLAKVDGDNFKITTTAAEGLEIVTGNLWVGDGSPGTAAMDGEDFYVNGDSEFDGAATFDGAVAFNSTTAFSENMVFTVAADEYFQIDANTTANTGTAGVLDINVQSATNAHKGVTLTYQLENGATQAYGFYTDIDDDTSGAEVIDLYHAVNSAGTNATTKGFVAAATIDQAFVATLGAASKGLVLDAATTPSTSTTGALIDASFKSATTASQAVNIDVNSTVAGGAGELVTGIHIQLDDDANTATDILRGIVIDTDGDGTGLQHAIYVGDTAGIDAALFAARGYVRIGTGSTPGVTPGDDDLFVEGTAEFDGNIYADGNIVGDGATVISGTISTVTDGAATNPYTVTIAMCGNTFYNTQAIEFDLPEASTAIGCTLTFAVLHASNLDIDPEASDIIVNAADSAGDKIRSGTVGDTVTLQAVSASQWIVKSMYPAASDWVDAD